MIKRRNMAMQVVLYIVTFGIYSVYWFYSTAKEMLAYKKMPGSPGLWTFLWIIPLVNLYAAWKYSQAVEAFTEGKHSSLLIFILWLVFSPAVWFVTQSELNARAGAAKP